jgi:hypothetical protein
MKRTKKLTLEQHIKAGADLRAFRDIIAQLSTQIGFAYGKSKKVSRLAWRAYNALDDLRCELDNRVCDENRELEDVTRIYYGPGPFVATPKQKPITSI